MKLSAVTIALVFALTLPAAAGGIDNGDFRQTPRNNIALAGAAAKAKADADARAIAKGGNAHQRQQQAMLSKQQTTVRNTITHEAAASSAYAPTVYPAGDCGVGMSVGASDVIQAASIGLSWKNIPCVVRQEAFELEAIVGGSRGRDAALMHLHNYHKRMGPTLEKAGIVTLR